MFDTHMTFYSMVAHNVLCTCTCFTEIYILNWTCRVEQVFTSRQHSSNLSFTLKMSIFLDACRTCSKLPSDTILHKITLLSMLDVLLKIGCTVDPKSSFPFVAMASTHQGRLCYSKKIILIKKQAQTVLKTQTEIQTDIEAKILKR